MNYIETYQAYANPYTKISVQIWLGYAHTFLTSISVSVSHAQPVIIQPASWARFPLSNPMTCQKIDGQYPSVTLIFMRICAQYFGSHVPISQRQAHAANEAHRSGDYGRSGPVGQIAEVSHLPACARGPGVYPQDRMPRLMNSIPCTGSVLRNDPKVTR